MEKKYFTALIPASNLDSKYKKMQIGSPLKVSFPPIAQLEVYEKPISKDEFHKNINSIPEFKTGNIVKKGLLWVIQLPKEYFEPIFKLKDLYIILGDDNSSNWTPPDTATDIIRNWELGFFELINWDKTTTLNNFELNLLWKIKKRREKG